MTDGVTKISPPEGEKAAAHRLVTVTGPRIDALAGRWEGPNREASPGSPLAADDEISKPFQVSHAAWHAIGHSIDNLAALRALLIPQKAETAVVTRPYAAYPTLRAAFETASTAAWLIAAKRRDVRVTRRFRLALTEASHRDRAAKLTGTEMAAESTRDRRLRQIAPAASLRGLDQSAFASVGYRVIVREAAADLGDEPDDLEAIWSLLSALAHGDFWASTIATDRQTVKVSADGDSYTVLVTSSVGTVGTLADIAVAHTTRVLDLYDQRIAPPFA